MSTTDLGMTCQFTMKRLRLLNRYYKITNFYSFLKDLAIKGSIAFIVFVTVIVLLEYYFLDFEVLLNQLVEHFSPFLILAIFYVSETIIGLLPPEIFIAWASQSAHPWWVLFGLASVSYLGGITAYFIGRRLSQIQVVKNYLEEKTAQHIANLRKWGGLLIFIGATLPPPHALISLASGMIHYNFKHYLFWALFRYLRFIIYALVIFKIL